MNHFRLALIFLTTLPFAPKKKIADKELGRSVAYFATVGFLIGLINLFIFFLFDNLSGANWDNARWLFALAITVNHLFLTGGLHMDGLMDSFDGIAASKTTLAETQKVMKDSRVGAFGSMAGTIALIARVIIMAQISYEYLIPVLVIAPLVSRLLVVLEIAYEPIQKTGTSSAALFKKYTNPPVDSFLNLIPFFVALILFVKILAYDLSDILFISAWSVFIGILFLKWLSKKLQGHSGDSYGAGLEVSEIISYLLAAVLSY